MLGTLVVALLVVGMASPASAVGRPDPAPASELDVRLPSEPGQRAGFVLRTPSAAQLAVADALALEMPGLVLRWNGMSGSPAWLAAGSALSPPLEGPPEQAARAFLLARAELFGLSRRELQGLRVTRDVPAPDGGAHVRFAQWVGGVEVFGGGANVTLAADGSVRSAGSSLYTDVRPSVVVQLDAAEAVRTAALRVYPEIPFVGIVGSAQTDGERRVVFDDPGFGRPPQARLVLFPEAEGARWAWEVRVAEPTLYTDYRILVDAADGRTLFRHNLTVYASARALTTAAPEPDTEEVQPDQHVLQTIPSSTPESPAGWISGDGSSLLGNNATSRLHYYSGPGLTESTAIYDYPYNTTDSGLVNAWWWSNDAHDRFYALGFDEVHGNYQQDNFGMGGLEGDPVAVTVFSAGPRDNAFFAVSNDGGFSSANFLWGGCRSCGDHDGYPENGGDRNIAFVRDVVYHEYAHGVTHRILGAGCLVGAQPAGLDEGWSDIFAVSFEDHPRLFAHFNEGFGWSRDARQDLTYGDVCAVGDRGCWRHWEGMIWLATLWDLRSSMIALDPVSGRDDFERLLLEGLERTPCDFVGGTPSFLDARDGILSADSALYGSAHEKLIWNAFAARGMGADATTSSASDPSPVPGTAVPVGQECIAPAVPSGLAAQATAANTIRLTYSAPGASAVEIWRRDVDVPWSVAERIAFTTDLATYDDTTVQGGKTYEYSIAALGDGGLPCSSARTAAVQQSATGACQAYPVFDPNLAVADGSASCELALSWSAATAGCPGGADPIVYNVYRAPWPGYQPSDGTLIGRTASTTFDDEPAADGKVYYYLVLAQHGTLADKPDHRHRGNAQVLRWVPRLPMLGRATQQFWDFEAGPAGWTTDNTDDPSGAWTLGDPVGTRYAGTMLAPDAAAGGSGQAWVTGNPASPDSVTSHDCDGNNLLISPTWDSSGDATLLSFDYWAHVTGNFYAQLFVRITTPTEEVLVPVVGLLTVQPFDTDQPLGWQRAEIDLAEYVTPGPNTRVAFIPNPDDALPLSEFGIDNVRIESASPCARSALAISAVTVDDSPAGWGNGNGILEPGETGRLIVELANDGGATATSPVGTLTSRTPNARVHEDSDSFPDIPVAGFGTSAGDGFTVTAPAFDCGEVLNFEFEFTDAAGTRSVQLWALETGDVQTQLILADDFETDLGWFADGAFSGQGVWQRGDPVGTMDGSNQANPEDCADGPGTLCWVTENGVAPDTDPNDDDVDSIEARLLSPLLDFTGYKRARMDFDLWYYDNSPDPVEDWGFWGSITADGLLETIVEEVGLRVSPTVGWERHSSSLVGGAPLVADVYVGFAALDQDGTLLPGAQDHVVEMGVDNVEVWGDWPTCSPSGVPNPPNGVGNTLRVNKSGGNAEIAWVASPVDATHDAAAYYELWASTLPSSAFVLEDSATEDASCDIAGDCSVLTPLDPVSEFFKVSAVNAAGTSGDRPAP